MAKKNKGSRTYRLKRQKRKKRILVSALVTLICLGVVFAMGAYVYHNLQKSVSKVDTKDYDKGYTRPTREPLTDPGDPFSGALNILLIGSDERTGKAKKSVEGMRSDTTMIAHISKDRKHVSLVSIPRDSWVKLPSCTVPKQGTYQAHEGKFNAAFAIGGQTGDVGSAVACTKKTIEELTGVYIDDYVVINFKGFSDVVDALGGVEFDVKQEINDPKNLKIRIKEGKQTLNGKQALTYARARKGVGMDGSDLSRIGRQQELLEVILKKAKQKTSNIPAMYKLAQSGLKMVTTSSQLGDLQKMVGLGWSLHSIDSKNISTVMVPIMDRGDGENVVWTEKANTLWRMMQEDKVITDETLEKEHQENPALPTETPTEEADGSTDSEDTNADESESTSLPTLSPAPTTETP